MCNGEYLFINTDLDTPATHPWKIGDANDELVKQAYSYVIQVSYEYLLSICEEEIAIT